MKRLLILFLALVLLTFTACSENDDSQPPLATDSVIVLDDYTIPDDVSPDVTGIVTSISTVREGKMLLVENESDNTDYVYVTVTDSAVVENKNKQRYASIDAISLGDTISVWASGVSDTSPSYAVANGVRITDHTSDDTLTVGFNLCEIMASSVENTVSSSDTSSQLYGSYISAFNGSTLSFEFSDEPLNFSAILPNELVSTYDADADEAIEIDKIPMVLECSAESFSCSVPSDLSAGEYVVEVAAEYSDRVDYYIFTLSVE